MALVLSGLRGCVIGKAFFEGAGDEQPFILALVTGKFCVLHRLFLITLLIKYFQNDFSEFVL